MLETILDSEIFIDFCKSQPAPIPEGTENEHNAWNSFWYYLKSGTNLTFIENDSFRGQKAESRFLTALTSGRGDAKLSFAQKFNWPYKNILPKETYPGSFYCLNQNDPEKRNQLRIKNGLLWGFMDDYKRKWCDLAFNEKSKILSIRKKVKDAPSLDKWSDLKDYILPFTDVIICDNFLLNDPSIRDYNFLEILKVLDSTVKSNYNLLIVTHEGTNKVPVDIDEFYFYINSSIQKLKLKAKAGIVLASHSIREHDRCIIMNYLRIRSGNSLNYFNRLGELIIKGTEVDFWPFCIRENFLTTQVIIESIKEIVDNENKYHQDTHVRGFINNRLFEYCDD